MGLTILLGLGAAVCWGAPDVWLAQATRRVGAVAVLVGSLLIGLVLIAPAAAFVEPPSWSTRGVLLAVGVGLMSALAYCVGFTAFRGAPVADDLGVYWGFLLIRASALLGTLPVALATGATTEWTRDPWRVAAWGVGDSAAYLLFVAAADRGPVAVASVLAAQFATVAVVAGLLSGERPLLRQRVGIGLVIVAVTVIAAAGG